MLSASLHASRRSLRTKSTALLSRSSRTAAAARTPARPPRALASTSRWYSTEKILTHRRRDLVHNSSTKGVAARLPATLYDASTEKENCGVGMVASLKSVASRKVVTDANEMLVRMSHRGGVGCCPASGDGAGEYLCFICYFCKRVFLVASYSTGGGLLLACVVWCTVAEIYTLFCSCYNCVCDEIFDCLLVFTYIVKCYLMFEAFCAIRCGSLRCLFCCHSYKTLFEEHADVCSY